ncbi:MAG: ankyrin repeat domain-containing protein [Candidatus Babeliales bacterium]
MIKKILACIICVSVSNAQDVTVQIKPPTAEELKIQNFIDAATRGKIDILQKLLNSGIDVNVKGPGGQTALHRAASAADTNIVAFLLEKGANASITDKQNETPLIAAVRSFSRKQAELADEHYKKIIPNPDTATAEEKAAARAQATAQATKETSPIIEALVRMLIQQGADIDMQNNNRQTALMLATATHLESVVKLLLNAGANIELINMFKQQAVDLADPEKNKIIRDLLTAAKDFIAAAAAGNKEVLEKMPKSTVFINSRDINGLTALHHAARNGHIEIINFLLEHGAQIESKDKTGQTPLHLAAQSGQANAVKLLLDKGANLESLDKEDNNTLIIAIKAYPKHKDQEALLKIARILIEHGINVDKQNKSGQTALIFATTFDLITLVQLLLEIGANVDLQDNLKRNAIDWAKNHLTDLLLATDTKTQQDRAQLYKQEIQRIKAERLKAKELQQQEALRLKEEARRLEEETKRLEALRKQQDQLRRKEEKARRQEEDKRLKADQAKRLEALRKQQEDLQRAREQEAQRQAALQQQQPAAMPREERLPLPAALNHLEQRLDNLQIRLRAQQPFLPQEPLVEKHQ